MNKFIKSTEDLLMPISKYSEDPNLSNLNRLGALLRLKVELTTLR